MLKIGEDVYIEKTEFNGVNYISIRKWFTDKNGDLKPTRKGINFKEEEWKEFVDKFEEIKGEVE